MEKTLRSNERLLRDTGLSGVLECVGLGIALAAGIALCAASLFYSVRISPERYYHMQVMLFEENELTNLVLLVIAVVGLRLIGHIRMSKRFADWFCAGVLGVLTLLGLLYITGMPRDLIRDSEALLNFAERITQGEANVLAPDGYPFVYLSRYPYQLSLLALFTGGIKLFGTEGFVLIVRLLNVFLTVGAYGVLLWMVKAYTDKPNVRVLTALLLLTLIQPILACTFVYGQIPAFALSVFAMGALIIFFRGGATLGLGYSGGGTAGGRGVAQAEHVDRDRGGRHRAHTGCDPSEAAKLIACRGICCGACAPAASCHTEGI